MPKKEKVFRSMDEFKKHYFPEAYKREQEEKLKPKGNIIYIGKGIRFVFLPKRKKEFNSWRNRQVEKC